MLTYADVCWRVQARVPFLDKAFMDVVMHLDPKVLHLLALLVLRYK